MSNTDWHNMWLHFKIRDIKDNILPQKVLHRKPTRILETQRKQLGVVQSENDTILLALGTA